MAAALLYSDLLPLRRAADLPQYRADAADRYLPWVFGRATLAPVPLDAEGAEWLVADHPIVSIDRVTVKGAATQGWQLVHRLDATGHPIAVLRLAQPTTADPVTVTAAGRRHPATGALLDTAPAIVRELMRLAGHQAAQSDWAGLDADYGRTQLGLVLQEQTTLRAAIASVLEPLHAMWRPGWAARRAPGQPVATLAPDVVEEITASADKSALYTSARVTYAHDWAAGAPRASLRLAAPAALALWGDIPQDISLPAVRNARDAAAIATWRLADAARVLWNVKATVQLRAGALQEGDTIELAHPHAPRALAVITAVEIDREHSTCTLSAEAFSTAAPAVELQRRSAAIDAASTTPAPVSYRNGIATFTVSDDQGDPLPGATVTLDGLYTALTDAAGQVQFRTARGAHTLNVRAAGYAQFTLDVVV
jgi:hypothetical protein